MSGRSEDKGELVELLRRLDAEHSGPTMRWAAAVIRNLVRANTSGSDALSDLIEKASDSRYSDEWVGNAFRASLNSLLPTTTHEKEPHP